MSNPTAPRNDRWPRQIKYIVGNEACERFSYYGMKGILAGYMTGEILKGGLNMSDDKATSIFHLFVFANYFTPLLGAWLSDKLFGRYGTILWVSLFYCAGHGVLAMSPAIPGLVETSNNLAVVRPDGDEILVVTSDVAATWDAWADGLGGVEVRRKPIDYEQIRSTLRALSARLGADD